jgi:hypothetical protein
MRRRGMSTSETSIRRMIVITMMSWTLRSTAKRTWMRNSPRKTLFTATENNITTTSIMRIRIMSKSFFFPRITELLQGMIVLHKSITLQLMFKLHKILTRVGPQERKEEDLHQEEGAREDFLKLLSQKQNLQQPKKKRKRRSQRVGT